MAFWASDDRLDVAPPLNERTNTPWGFGNLDVVDGLRSDDQDLDDWFADLPPAGNSSQERRDAFTELPFSNGQEHSPSPVHGGYASWMTGNSSSPARAAVPRRQNRPSATALSPQIPSRYSLQFRLENSPPPFPNPNYSLNPPRQPPPPPPRAPAPNHSNDWLDPTEARRSARTPYVPEPFATLESESDSSSSISSDSEFDDGVDIDDFLNEEEEEEAAMAPTTRRAQQQHPRNSIVDLTNDPSSPPRPIATTARKRSRDDSTQDRTSNKRTRRASHTSTPNAVEELDLTNEAPSAEEELLQTTQAAAIAAQQAATSSDRPLRVGQRTCIICMEPYTNATITACGHIYCHECLTQALEAGEKNSERGVGNCPVCRKPVNRKKDKQMVPVNFMKKEAFKDKGRRAGRV